VDVWGSRACREVGLLVLGACSYSPSPFNSDTDSDGGQDAPLDAFVKRINVGGEAFTGADFPGNWEADDMSCRGSGTGIGAALPISGTNDDPLFALQVFGIPTTTCAIPVPDGTYDVLLLFGPIYYGSGANPPCPFATREQIFDIAIEGTVVEPAFDVTTESQGCVGNGTGASHPVSKQYRVMVTDGMFDMVLTAPGQEASMISAIQLVQRN